MGGDGGVAEPFEDRQRFLGGGEFAGQLGLRHQGSGQPDRCAETAAGRDRRREERGKMLNVVPQTTSRGTEVKVGGASAFKSRRASSN